MSSYLYFSVPIALIAILFTLPWEKEIKYGFDRVATLTDADGPLETDLFERSTVFFNSYGTKCEAWLYTPKGTTDSPIIIMAHGLGGQKDFGLDKYAAYFASHGMGVFLFDYRNFGGSDGEPRNLVSPTRHVQDWESAVKFIKTSSGLGPFNTTKVVLWGTSLSGGHVLMTASKFLDDVSCVIAQVPHLDGRETSKKSFKTRGVLGVLRVASVAIHDKLRSIAGLPPACIKLAGSEQDLAFMQLDETELFHYYAKHPQVKKGGWQNMAPARAVLDMPRYSPIHSLSTIKAPVMMVNALRDSLCAPEVIRKAAKQLGEQGVLLEYDLNHFQIYQGEAFEDSASKMVDFIRLHTGAPVWPSVVTPPEATSEPSFE